MRTLDPDDVVYVDRSYRVRPTEKQTRLRAVRSRFGLAPLSRCYTDWEAQFNSRLSALGWTPGLWGDAASGRASNTVSPEGEFVQFHYELP